MNKYTITDETLPQPVLTEDDSKLLPEDMREEEEEAPTCEGHYAADDDDRALEVGSYYCDGKCQGNQG